MWQALYNDIQEGKFRALARAISLVENEQEGWLSFMQSLPAGHARVVGITGPPGAGKSTITDALIGAWVNDNKIGRAHV